MSSSSQQNALHKARLRAQAQELKEAADFYEGKLRAYPSMSRYTHYMGALTSAQGDLDKADAYYRQTIVCAPQDISARNDFALHLANTHGRRDDGIKELKKASLIVDQHPLIEKNMAALLGESGDLRGAMHHATQARYLAPQDAMNHRNLAKLHSAMGDTYTALQHNMTSIDIEEHRLQPNTSAYRSAAVQIIARGGAREDALALMTAARSIENKHLEMPTSERTYEIIHKIKQRQAHQLEQAEKEKKLAEEKRQAAEKEWQKVVARSSNW